MGYSTNAFGHVIGAHLLPALQNLYLLQGKVDSRKSKTVQL